MPIRDSNQARTQRAETVLRNYAALVGESLFDILADDVGTGEPMQGELIDWILADLLHYCAKHGINFDLRLQMAEDHFRDEKEEEDGS